MIPPQRNALSDNRTKLVMMNHSGAHIPLSIAGLARSLESGNILRD